MKNSLKISLLTLFLSFLTMVVNTTGERLTEKWSKPDAPKVEQSYEQRAAPSLPADGIKPVFDPSSITKENIFQSLVPIVYNALLFILSFVASWIPGVSKFSTKGAQTLAIAVVVGIGAMMFGVGWIQVGIGYLITTLFYDKIAQPVLKA